jgi:translation initiation factor IF-3
MNILRINREIRAEKVRVIGSDGSQVGVITTREALSMAESERLDLVEISSNSNPPVCRIIDYGKYRYQQAKKEKENKKAQHQVRVKEIKLKPNIDNHDFLTKAKRAHDFLLKGDKVRVTCTFRGREMLHTELGEKVVRRMCEELTEISIVEAPLKRMGRIITLVLAPQTKKKSNKQENN